MKPIRKNDVELIKYLKLSGFEPNNAKYPLHLFQEIPVIEIVLTVLAINILSNILNSEHKD